MNQETKPNPQTGDYNILRLGLGYKEEKLADAFRKAIPPNIPAGWRAFVRYEGGFVEFGIEKFDAGPSLQIGVSSTPCPTTELPARDWHKLPDADLRTEAGMRNLKPNKNATRTELLAMLGAK